MNTSSANLIEKMALQNTKSLYFPEGLPAFESHHEYVLMSQEEEAPFLWLQSVSNPNLAFVVIDPFLICSHYRPDISDDDVKLLEIDKPEDALLLSVVNVRNSPGEGVTANLVSPIVINHRKRLGKQSILKNHLDYSVRFRIEQQDQDPS